MIQRHMDDEPVVALEIGTTKVRALVARPRDDNHLFITGLGECASRGIRKSEIVDFENAVASVRIALQNAEENSNTTISEVYLLVSGGHLQSTVNRGSIPILHEPHEIAREDMDHVMSTARTVNLPSDRAILHTICQHYYVDDQAGVVNPIGLEGSRLSLDMLILHGVRARMKNLVRVASSVSVDVRDVSFTGLCSGLAVLDPEQKENGVLVIDLGGGTVSYLAYAGGAIAAAGCLGVGGDHVTNDLARGLRIPQPHAETLKEQYGAAILDAAARGQKIELLGETGSLRRMVRLGDVQTITSYRAEEILNMVRQQIEQTGKRDLLHHLGSGIVLTGGGAYLKGMTVLCEKTFGLPCELGKPRDISGLTLGAEGAQYAAPIGMLRYAVRTAQRDEPQTPIGALIRKLLGR